MLLPQAEESRHLPPTLKATLKTPTSLFALTLSRRQAAQWRRAPTGPKMQGFNMGRYVPPDLVGVKSFNQASGKKPSNTKRTADGSTVQTVRFECPFAIWCTTCHPEAIIGQGVRFNAQKQKVGSYYSTPVWSFRFKHTLCGGWIEVRTDPQNTEYVVTSGGRRRDDGRDKVLEGEMVIGETDAELVAARLKGDGAFGALEKNVKDKELAGTQKARVVELRKRSERDWSDPYEINRRVRREFRVGRRQRQDDERTGEALQERFGLGMDVAAPAVEDRERARLMDFAGNGVEDGRTTARGIFDAKASERDSGIRTKVKKLADVAQQKTALQTSLKGNTRAKSDPFLKDEQAWHPVRREPNRPSQQPQPELEETKPMTSTPTATLVAYDSD